MFGLGAGELILILLLLVFFFGASRIPQIARGLGAGIRNFKGELKQGASGSEQNGHTESDESRLPPS
ncbi:MAG: twin-arginine translocase TatA/TatE family subunit [Gemmatimonadetes bacterium]|nr:MAG: twin-arginine translocase TatA/TatE family subunit [Gemmatimonadota bacterium]